MNTLALTTAKKMVFGPRNYIHQSIFTQLIHSSLPVTARSFARGARDLRASSLRTNASLQHALADEPILEDSVTIPSISASAFSSSTSTPLKSTALLDTDTNGSSRVDQTLFVAGIPNVAREQHLTEYFEDLGIIVRDVFVPSAFNQNGQKRKHNRGFGFVEVGTVKEHQQLIRMSKNKKIEFDLKPAKWDIERARSYGTPSPSIAPKIESKPKDSKARPDDKARSRSAIEPQGTEKKKARRRIPSFSRR
ncbi:RNA recognition motif domain [Phaffia rhodozyma]|uniref:RNA recognition motif domain n=1 Tax=Phaffia rhodozyma TaxID=264483 RepID=A0A0F7SP79_PHARH|nr:RNA recognition motif domain [Phaffia rhodozyma]